MMPAKLKLAFFAAYFLMAPLAGCSNTSSDNAVRLSKHMSFDNGFLYHDNTAYLLVREDDLRSFIRADNAIVDLYISNKKQLSRLLALQVMIDKR